MARPAHNGLQRDRIAVVVIVTTTTIHTLKSPRHGVIPVPSGCQSKRGS